MYNYRIYEEVYNQMISGKKHIEVRLLNEKSASIKKGDIRKFSVLDSDKYLNVKVLDIYDFKNIDELWQYKDIVADSSMNYTKEEFITALYNIFGEDNVKNSKIVAIQFEKIDKEKKYE